MGARTSSNYMNWDEAQEALRLAVRRLDRFHCVADSRPVRRWWTRQ